MTGGRHYVCWQPVLTDHQAFTLHALARLDGGTITAYIGGVFDRTREAQGWTRSAEPSLPEVLLPRKGWFAEVRSILSRTRRDIHIFGSPFEDLRLFVTFLLALFGGHEVYLVSEPYSPIAAGYFGDEQPFRRWLKMKARRPRYAAYARLMGRRIAGLFAISPLAVIQYVEAGVPPSRIFPFGYFVPAAPIANVPPPSRREAGSPLRLIYVGSFIERKGLSVLADAIGRVRAEGLDVEVDLYGPGSPDPAVVAVEGVYFRGRIRFGEAQQVMSRYDALVVPSLYDGWAVVVNEAFLAGIPVLCSDGVGAGAMVLHAGGGAVFPAGRAGDLAARIHRWADHPEEREAAASAARAFRPRITPQVAARYMRDVMDHIVDGSSRPPCPWYSVACPGGDA